MKIKIALIFCTLIIASGIFFVWQKQKPTGNMVFTNVSVALGDIQIEILATGQVRPENRVEIRPPIAGRIEEVLVVEGQEVKRGDVLAWMSSNDRAALLDAARSRGEADFQRWQELHRPTPIIAPINGVIIRRNVEAGQSFTAGGDAILVMSDRLIVRAHVDETDVAEIYLGQSVDITLDAFPAHRITAKVGLIAHEAETANNITTYAITIIPDHVPDFMRSGMTANTRFLTHSAHDVVVVRPEAIIHRDRKQWVRVIDNGRVSERQVQVGITDGLRVEIQEGLKVGEVIQVPQVGGGRQSGRRPQR